MCAIFHAVISIAAFVAFMLSISIETFSVNLSAHSPPHDFIREHRESNGLQSVENAALGVHNLHTYQNALPAQTALLEAGPPPPTLCFTPHHHHPPRSFPPFLNNNENKKPFKSVGAHSAPSRPLSRADGAAAPPATGCQPAVPREHPASQPPGAHSPRSQPARPRGRERRQGPQQGPGGGGVEGVTVRHQGLPSRPRIRA